MVPALLRQHVYASLGSDWLFVSRQLNQVTFDTCSGFLNGQLLSLAPGVVMKGQRELLPMLTLCCVYFPGFHGAPRGSGCRRTKGAFDLLAVGCFGPRRSFASGLLLR